MTVGELIDALKGFPLDLNVYVPDTRDGTAQIARGVDWMQHVNLPDGVSIPDDVCITPWTYSEFLDMHGIEEGKL